MGNPKQKWTPDEEEALRAGVKKHGTGKWKDIQKDPEFNPFLSSRSNIDLKDKWRNMTVSGLGPREKSRTPKAKANPDAPATPLSNPQTSAAAPIRRDAAAPAVAAAAPFADDSSTVLPDGKAALLCNEMIFEALSSSTDPNGMDTGAIAGFIEQRHEVPQNFRRLLSTRLRRLVAQDKLEKNQNCYKLKSNSSLGTKTPAPPALPAPPVPKPKDVQPRQLHSPFYGTPGDTIGEAAVAAAYKIAEAENKSFVAAEAVKEAERISQMAEDTESLLQLAKDIFEKCSQGEVALMV